MKTLSLVLPTLLVRLITDTLVAVVVEDMIPDPDKPAQHQYGKTQVRLDLEEVIKSAEPSLESSKTPKFRTTEGPRKFDPLDTLLTQS